MRKFSEIQKDPEGINNTCYKLIKKVFFTNTPAGQHLQDGKLICHGLMGWTDNYMRIHNSLEYKKDPCQVVVKLEQDKKLSPWNDLRDDIARLERDLDPMELLMARIKFHNKAKVEEIESNQEYKDNPVGYCLRFRHLLMECPKVFNQFTEPFRYFYLKHQNEITIQLIKNVCEYYAHNKTMLRISKRKVCGVNHDIVRSFWSNYKDHSDHYSKCMQKEFEPYEILSGFRVFGNLEKHFAGEYGCLLSKPAR